MRYILSAFWEGQEGSFMLWMIWHAVLGMFVWRRDYKWESPVLAVVVLINAVIFSMLLGLYIDFGDTVFKIGANPTLLLRNVLELPLFMNADYTSLITGNGLNPLLQNYWMTIHPPMLFLGFASTAFPFAFAIAGLWTGDHKGWLKPATNWSLFSAGVLGTGILMGAIWAYEALSFGGYWAWDPVENASLVPWMLLVAGVHTHLIARNSGYAIRSTYLFYILTFVFILYSTYLTRSGVLGETSVHAFTEMGLGYQLVFFVLFFLLLGIFLYIYRYKSIPAPEREENIKSREFWMFIGSLVLMFGGFLIISSTSLPVFNKIATYFNEDYIGRVIEDPIEHFNKFQLWIAVFISILSSVAIYLRYGSKQRKWSRITKHILIAAVIAAVLTYLLTFWISYKGAWQYTLLTFFGLFAMVANVDYIFTQTKNDIRLSSSAVAHFGFGAMMLGIITSGLNQSFISNNPFVFG
ncbi:cytochrome c biogenesis protein CcsA, partial [Gammaproteobacteria bacterium]|nr:cytochrome c biogenesis protein CcsA [Gammaproteobacteria bacterium]